MTDLPVPEPSQHDKMSKKGEGCTLRAENAEVSRWCRGGGADAGKTGLLTEDCSHP